MNIKGLNPEWKIFLVYLLVLVLITKPYSMSDNEASRFNAIKAMVENHRLEIGTSGFTTVDKVYIDGKFYSDKPPVLSFFGALVYFPIYHLIGSFKDHTALVPYLMKVMIIGVTSSFLLVIFYRALSLFDVDTKTKYFLTFSLGFTTLLFTYANAFNNHTVAAFLSFTGFYYYLLWTEKKQENFFMMGLLFALSSTIDVVSGGIFLVVFSIVIFFNQGITTKNKCLFFISFLIPLMLHILLNYPITHHILPGEALPKYYHYEGSLFLEETPSGVYNHESLKSFLIYSFHSLLGKRGLFSYTPSLIIGFLLLFVFCKEEEERKYLPVLTSVLGIFLYYVVFTSNYGGSSYGMRWFVPVVPFLFFISCFVFIDERFFKYQKLFYTLLIYSLIIALIGAFLPWPTPAEEGLQSIPVYVNFKFMWNNPSFYFFHMMG